MPVTLARSTVHSDPLDVSLVRFVLVGGHLMIGFRKVYVSGLKVTNAGCRSV